MQYISGSKIPRIITKFELRSVHGSIVGSNSLSVRWDGGAIVWPQTSPNPTQLNFHLGLDDGPHVFATQLPAASQDLKQIAAAVAIGHVISLRNVWKKLDYDFDTSSIHPQWKCLCYTAQKYPGDEKVYQAIGFWASVTGQKSVQRNCGSSVLSVRRNFVLWQIPAKASGSGRRIEISWQAH